MVLKQVDVCMETINLNPYLTLFMKFNETWVIDLNKIDKIYLILKNIEEKHCTIGINIDSLNRIYKHKL